MGPLSNGSLSMRYEEDRSVVRAVATDFSVGYQTFKCSFRFDQDVKSLPFDYLPRIIEIRKLIKPLALLVDIFTTKNHSTVVFLRF